MNHVISTGTCAGVASIGSVAELLFNQSAARPDHRAVVHGTFALTYRQLAGRATAMAEQIASLGVQKGDKIALLFPNQPEYVAAFFAVAALGATVVPVNPLLKSDEIAHILSDSESKLLIVDEKCFAEVAGALANAPQVEHVLICGSAAGKTPVTGTSFSLLTDGESHTGADWLAAIEPVRDLAVLVYTSGTTGKPKGAMITHENLSAALDAALDGLSMSADDRCLAVLPLCHIYGLTVVMLGMVARGGTVIVLEKFESAGALALIEQERVTVIPAVPAMYQFMIMETEKKKFDLSSVRLCLCGAAALAPELIPQIESAFGAPLIEGYGMTETTCVTSLNPIEGLRKAGSVGIDFGRVVVAILGDDGTPLYAGSENVGEIAVRGPNVMLGYYKKPQATAEVFQKGWLLTGDLGYKDEDGYLYIVGRKKELIIRGGQNIYPREVEEVILRMDGVAEVAVVGVPDKYMGERVKAVVVLKPGISLADTDIKEFCAQRLAEYKVPRLVDFVAALPRNSTGKVLKRLLS